MTHKYSVIKCPVCGLVIFPNGEKEYFVDVRKLMNFDIIIKECDTHEDC
jgi:hypothetical protein